MHVVFVLGVYPGLFCAVTAGVFLLCVCLSCSGCADAVGDLILTCFCSGTDACPLFVPLTDPIMEGSSAVVRRLFADESMFDVSDVT